MKRIMVVGNCGVGKSTFSKQLSLVTDIELIHLDLHYWKPNWVEPSKEEWRIRVQEMTQKSTWIIDGNYGGTMDIRIDKADTIIFLDYPVRKAIWRVIKRTVKYWKKVRPDMPIGCAERFDFNFFFYVATFRFRRKNALLEKLASNKDKKHILIFNNDSEVKAFLETLEI